MQYRWDIINHFIKKYNYKSYLEIGYYKGWSFDQVECDFKVAVDPNPSKHPEQETLAYNSKIIWVIGYTEDGGKKCSQIIYKLTSDDFFSREIPEGTGKYDIIFIDGLHEAPQALRDVQNSLNHLNPGGIIIMHDCNPPKYEHTTTGIDGCWTGEVYKAYTTFTCDPLNRIKYISYVIDTDWGVGVIRKMNIPDNLPTGLKLALRGGAGIGMDDIHIDMITDWDYFDKHRKSLLNLISVEEFLDREK